MADYVVVTASLRITTGKEDPLTRLPKTIKFTRGQTVDSDKFDTEEGRAKIERLLRAGALRDPDDVPAQTRQQYASDFDIPLDRDPGGNTEDRGSVVKLPGDDIDEDEEGDDSELETVPEPTDTETTPAETDPSETQEPPAPSRSASTAVWEAFARQIGLAVPESATRQQIQDEYDARAQG